MMMYFNRNFATIIKNKNFLIYYTFNVISFYMLIYLIIFAHGVAFSHQPIRYPSNSSFELSATATSIQRCMEFPKIYPTLFHHNLSRAQLPCHNYQCHTIFK